MERVKKPSTTCTFIKNKKKKKTNVPKKNENRFFNFKIG